MISIRTFIVPSRAASLSPTDYSEELRDRQPPRRRAAASNPMPAARIPMPEGSGTGTSNVITSPAWSDGHRPVAVFSADDNPTRCASSTVKGPENRPRSTLSVSSGSLLRRSGWPYGASGRQLRQGGTENAARMCPIVSRVRHPRCEGSAQAAGCPQCRGAIHQT
jgi:hypothetical protein